MLALIAGTGALPAAVLGALPERPLVCALYGFTPEVLVDITFRIERLGGFLKTLKARGVTRVCMVGAIRRPAVNPRALDLATLRLVPTIWRSLRKGDDGALRGFIAVLAQRGFQVVGAHEAAPALLPPAGVPTKAQPLVQHRADALAGQVQLAIMGAADLGQACVIRDGAVIAAEDDAGTDAMSLKLQPEMTRELMASDPLTWAVDALVDWFEYVPAPSQDIEGAILFKGPKPRQDRRADLPVIGLRTAMNAAAAGLAGIVIEAEGVIVLDLAGLIDVLDAQGMFLWVRPKGTA